MSIDHDLDDGLDGGLDGGLAAELSGRVPDGELVSVLDAVDPAGLSGPDLAAYVRACWRVHNRAEAALLWGMRELGMAQDGQTTRLARR